MTVRLVTQEQIDDLLDLATRLKVKGLEEESQWLAQVLDDLRAGSDSIPASMAAEILAVTPQTVRNWVRAGIIDGHTDDTGHFYVNAGQLESAIRIRRALPRPSPRSVAETEIDAEIAAVRSTKRREAAGGH